MVDPFARSGPMPEPEPRNPAGAVQALMAQAEAAMVVSRQVGELVGTAESDDGYIRVEVGSAGLQHLALEPRAMRMPSTDLAEAVVELTRQASDDLDAQRQQLLEDAGVSTGGVDLTEAQHRLAELDRIASTSNGDMQAVYERFRHNLLR